MKKIIAAGCFFITLFFASNAQGIKNPSDAKKILDQVSAKFKTYKSVQANFLLKIDNAAGKNLGTKKGTVSMKATKYAITIPGQVIISDGTTLWTYEKSSNEVTINKIDPSANAITPQKLFTNFYDKDFLYKYNGMVTEGGKSMQEIELTPTDKSKPFFKVLLYITNATIYTTKIFEKAGARYTYTVNNMKTGLVLADNIFTFDIKKYPGLEVVDLR